MLLKSATIYHTQQEPDLSGVDAKVKELVLKPATSSMPVRVGFVPIVRGSELWTLQQEKTALFHIGLSKKRVSPSLVKETLLTEIDKRERATGIALEKSEKKELKEAITQNLLHEAPEQRTYHWAYIDPTNAIFVTDATSDETLTLVYRLMYTVFGSFKVVHYMACLESSPVSVMTSWVTDYELPSPLQQGASINLDDKDEAGESDDVVSAATLKAVDYFDETVQAYLKAGMQVQKMELVIPNKSSFMLNNDFTLSRLKGLGHYQDQHDELFEGGQLSTVETGFFLQRAALQEILDVLKPLLSFKAKTD